MSYRLTCYLIGIMALGLLASTPVLAAQSPWYGGANVSFNSGFSGFGGSTGFDVYGGYLLPGHVWRFKPAVEVGYDHYGSMTETDLGGTGFTGVLSGHDIAASAIFTYAIMPRLGAYLRAGLADVSLTYTLSGYGSSASASASGINFLFGIGVNYRITPQIGVHAEYRNTGASLSGLSGAMNSFVLGATYRF